MRWLLVLSTVALACSVIVFVERGVPAVLRNARAQTALVRREQELIDQLDSHRPAVTEEGLRQARERDAASTTSLRKLLEGIGSRQQSFASFLVSPAGPLPGFTGTREEVYLELANQTLAIAARAGIPRPQPYLEVKTSEEVAALDAAAQEELLQRAFLIHRLVDCLTRSQIRDIRLIDIGPSADPAYAPSDGARKVTLIYAAPVDRAFEAVASFFALEPPPLCDPTAFEIERLDPAELGLAAIDFEAPPIRLRWEMTWLTPAEAAR